MSVPIPTYLEVMPHGVKAYCLGDGSDYDGIIWVGGNPLPSKAELDILIVEEIRKRQWLAIKDLRDSYKFGGVKVGNYWFHSDDSSRIQQLGLLALGSNLTPGVMWKTMSGVFVEMTPDLAQQIILATARSDLRIFTLAETKKQEMLNSENPSQYDQYSGWPEPFVET